MTKTPSLSMSAPGGTIQIRQEFLAAPAVRLSVARVGLPMLARGIWISPAGWQAPSGISKAGRVPSAIRPLGERMAAQGEFDFLFVKLGSEFAHCATLNDTGEDEIKRTEEVVAS